MTTFPNSPRILKGGLVLIDPESARVLRIIALQYNPEPLSRSLQIQSAGGEGGNRPEPMRFKGPAVCKWGGVQMGSGVQMGLQMGSDTIGKVWNRYRNECVFKNQPEFMRNACKGMNR